LPKLLHEVEENECKHRTFLVACFELIASLFQQSSQPYEAIGKELVEMAFTLNSQHSLSMWVADSLAQFGPGEKHQPPPYELPCNPFALFFSKWLDDADTPVGKREWYTASRVKCVVVASAKQDDESGHGDELVMTLKQGDLVVVVNKNPRYNAKCAHLHETLDADEMPWWAGRKLDSCGNVGPLLLVCSQLVDVVPISKGITLRHLLHIPMGIIYFSKQLIKEYVYLSLQHDTAQRQQRALLFRL
jgi:hypothetical protein